MAASSRPTRPPPRDRGSDSNGKFYPDCDFLNPAAQNLSTAGGDVCGAFTGANANFNLAVPTSFNDHDTSFGFNHRPFDWEFSAACSRSCIPSHAALDVAFFRRWFGNFTATDNYAVAPSDYATFSIVVPTDSRLPLSGQTVNGFKDLNPNVASLPSDNHVRFANKYGTQQEYWQGVDVNATVRLGGGTQIQGGFGTSKATTDTCDIVSQVPEAAVAGVSPLGTPSSIAGPQGTPFCHQSTPWLTQVKALATYTIPKVDLQLAGTFQALPGPQLGGQLVVPCGAGSAVAAQLGRNCTATGGNVTLNIVSPGSLYGERLYQTDFRLGKVVKFAGARRITGTIDLYNVFNGNAVLTAQSSYSLTNPGLWLTPLSVNSRPAAQVFGEHELLDRRAGDLATSGQFTTATI